MHSGDAWGAKGWTEVGTSCSGSTRARQEGRPLGPPSGCHLGLGRHLGGLGALAAGLEAVPLLILAANHEGWIFLALACSLWVVGSGSSGLHAVGANSSGSSCRPAPGSKPVADAAAAEPSRAALRQAVWSRGDRPTHHQRPTWGRWHPGLGIRTGQGCPLVQELAHGSPAGASRAGAWPKQGGGEARGSGGERISSCS